MSVNVMVLTRRGAEVSVSSLSCTALYHVSMMYVFTKDVLDAKFAGFRIPGFRCWIS